MTINWLRFEYQLNPRDYGYETFRALVTDLVFAQQQEGETIIHFLEDGFIFMIRIHVLQDGFIFKIRVHVLQDRFIFIIRI